MIILKPSTHIDYTLLDTGNGLKLEEFGNNRISRPDTNCVWQQHQKPTVWKTTNALYEKKGTDWAWRTSSSFHTDWTMQYILKLSATVDKKLVFNLTKGTSKNIGIFPEQAAHWEWFAPLLYQARESSPQVLNLFGHTGAASLCAAAAGARVCHVDASQAAITRAKRNQQTSNLHDASIRWIVDDCTTFVKREINRGNYYDAIIMDPPAFGRDTKGSVFEFEKRIHDLLKACAAVLKPDPLFFIFNGYSMGYSAMVLKNLLADYFPNQRIEYGELCLEESIGTRLLPCNLFARFVTKHKKYN